MARTTDILFAIADEMAANDLEFNIPKEEYLDAARADLEAQVQQDWNELYEELMLQQYGGRWCVC